MVRPFTTSHGVTENYMTRKKIGCIERASRERNPHQLCFHARPVKALEESGHSRNHNRVFAQPNRYSNATSRPVGDVRTAFAPLRDPSNPFVKLYFSCARMIEELCSTDHLNTAWLPTDNDTNFPRSQRGSWQLSRHMYLDSTR